MLNVKQGSCEHGSRQQGVRGPPLIFMHGTDIIDRSLKVLFFDLCYFWSFFRFTPSTVRGLIVLLFGLFCYFSDVFTLGPLVEIFLPKTLAVNTNF